MSDLIFFVLDMDEAEDQLVDPLTIDGIPPSHKQKLVKDMKVLEILTDIIYYPFANGVCGFDDIHEEAKHPKVFKILQLSYRLIKHVIREYRPNELYAS